MSEIGVILTIVLIILISYFIARKGILFFLLKCPKCQTRGGLRKQWTNIDNDLKNYDNVLDVNMDLELDKKLTCRKCGNEIYLSN